MHVNFAGHFVLATRSCGSGCHYLFIWDAVTGKVYRDFAFGAINVGPYGSASRGQQVEYGRRAIPSRQQSAGLGRML